MFGFQDDDGTRQGFEHFVLLPLHGGTERRPKLFHATKFFGYCSQLAPSDLAQSGNVGRFGLLLIADTLGQRYEAIVGAAEKRPLSPIVERSPRNEIRFNPFHPRVKLTDRIVLRTGRGGLPRPAINRR